MLHRVPVHEFAIWTTYHLVELVFQSMQSSSSMINVRRIFQPAYLLDNRQSIFLSTPSKIVCPGRREKGAHDVWLLLNTLIPTLHSICGVQFVPRTMCASMGWTEFHRIDHSLFTRKQLHSEWCQCPMKGDDYVNDGSESHTHTHTRT